MKILFLILACVSVFDFSARANLGDHPDKAEARYGKPISMTTNGVEVLGVFHTNNIQFEITFVRGVDLQEELTGLGTNVISIPQAEAFAQALTGRKDWQMVNSISGAGAGSLFYEAGQFRMSFTTGLGRSIVSINSTVFEAYSEHKKQAEAQAQRDAILKKFGNTN